MTTRERASALLLSGILCLTTALGSGAAAVAGTSAAGAAQQPGCQAFRETGQSVCGRFLSYWQEHGGLAQHGYPISAQFSERSEVDGKTYSVQYFQRAVFEQHPENKPPYDVLLSLLGSMRYKLKYPAGAPNQVPNNTVSYLAFPQTGMHLGGTFLGYWLAHGGISQQGLPISNEFTERSDLDGKRYVVQYFERAVLELHPENKPPYNVLLTQLGSLQMKRKYPTGASPHTVPPGTWGGSQVSLEVTSAGASIELSCAHGTINQPIALDSSGHFDAPGTYVQESGVPPAQDQNPQGQTARYSGSTDGTTMSLTVTLTPSNLRVGTFSLTLGKKVTVAKCMSPP